MRGYAAVLCGYRTAENRRKPTQIYREDSERTELTELEPSAIFHETIAAFRRHKIFVKPQETPACYYCRIRAVITLTLKNEKILFI